MIIFFNSPLFILTLQLKYTISDFLHVSVIILFNIVIFNRCCRDLNIANLCERNTKQTLENVLDNGKLK